jgi:hypothetical protein
MITANLRAVARKAARTAGFAAFAASLTAGFATGLAHADDTTTGGSVWRPGRGSGVLAPADL